MRLLIEIPNQDILMLVTGHYVQANRQYKKDLGQEGDFQINRVNNWLTLDR